MSSGEGRLMKRAIPETLSAVYEDWAWWNALFFRVWNDDPSLRVNDRARLEGGGCRRFDGSP